MPDAGQCVSGYVDLMLAGRHLTRNQLLTAPNRDAGVVQEFPIIDRVAPEPLIGDGARNQCARTC